MFAAQRRSTDGAPGNAHFANRLPRRVIWVGRRLKSAAQCEAVGMLLGRTTNSH